VPIGHLKDVFARDPMAHGDLNAKRSGTAEREFLFPVNYWVSQDHLRKAAKTVGIEYRGFGWHTFRRAFKTWNSKAGQAQGDSMALMGHNDSRTNEGYRVFDDQDFARRSAQEAALFGAVMFGKGGRA
jgi:integrase